MRTVFRVLHLRRRVMSTAAGQLQLSQGFPHDIKYILLSILVANHRVYVSFLNFCTVAWSKWNENSSVEQVE